MKKEIRRICLGTLFIGLLVLICTFGSIFSYLAYKGIIIIGVKTVIFITIFCILGSIIGFFVLSMLYILGKVIEKQRLFEWSK